MLVRRTQLRSVLSIIVTALALAWSWKHFRESRAFESPALEPYSVGVSNPPHEIATASISGRVSTPKGELVTGARVCAICASCDAVVTETQVCSNSVSQGEFALRNLKPIGYRVTASAPGHAFGRANQGRAVSINAGEAKHGVDIVLEDGGVELSGVVLDPRGRPIAGATVRAVQWEGHPSAVDVLTDADGRFRMWAKAAGTTLSALAEGHAASRRMYRTAPSTHMELVLSPAGSIAGIVTQNGTPIAGAEVMPFRAGYAPQAIRGTAYSDQNGRFLLENLEPDRYALVARRRGYQGVSEGMIAVEVGGTTDGIEIPVSHAVSVRGRVVTGSTRRPCEAGSVMLVPEVTRASANRPSAIPIIEPVGTNGELCFEGVSEGHYFVQVRCEDSLSGNPEPLVVAHDDLSGLEWRVERGLGLSVLVADEEGKPIPHAKFRLVAPPPPYLPDGPSSDSAYMANAAGRYEFPPALHPGKYRVQASYGGADGAHEGVDVELKNGVARAEVVLSLKGNARIVVTVVTPEGAPVDGLYIDGCRLEDVVGETEIARGCKSLLEARSIGGGQYQLAPLRVGSYRIELRDGINPPLVVTRDDAADFEVTAGAVVRTTMVVSREAEIRGRVVDQGGKPQANAWVGITGSADDVRSKQTTVIRRIEDEVYTLTDREGLFQLHRVAAGARFMLRASGAKGASAVEWAVKAGDDVRLVLRPEEIAKATAESGQ